VIHVVPGEDAGRRSCIQPAGEVLEEPTRIFDALKSFVTAGTSATVELLFPHHHGTITTKEIQCMLKINTAHIG